MNTGKLMELIEYLAKEKAATEQRHEETKEAAMEAAKRAIANLRRGDGYTESALSALKDAVMLVERSNRQHRDLQHINEARGKVAEALGLEDA